MAVLWWGGKVLPRARGELGLGGTSASGMAARQSLWLMRGGLDPAEPASELKLQAGKPRYCLRWERRCRAWVFLNVWLV